MPDSPSRPTYDEDAAFERVMQACRAAEAKGWTIAGMSFFKRGKVKTCCPIGAYILDTTGRASIQPGYGDNFARDTGLPRGQVGEFMAGIDAPMKWRKSRGARLARRVRAALWPDGNA